MIFQYTDCLIRAFAACVFLKHCEIQSRELFLVLGKVGNPFTMLVGRVITFLG